ncbi:hypothetical protein [Amycolatopsis sp. WAC 04169]|uniref:hypothetical protein n=1 Tax=Amycolatopsis sp. WAC 04169 TaxID=2203197 RepID=UPI000F7A3E8C|nr:hypothetical protein [Amycolatopsis sp. WAC 04169]
MALAATAVVALLAGSAPAYASTATQGPGEQSRLLTYMITDPDLVNNPTKVTEVLKRDGNLDALGLRPDPENVDRSTRRTAATEDPGYGVDSAQFDRGAKPENPYQYIEYPDCRANDDAARPIGWIKNRFSYCQKFLFPISYYDVTTGLTSTATIQNTIIGYGKIGPYPGNPTRRFADFRFTAQVLEPNGIFLDPRSEMEIAVKCAGEYRVDIGIDNDRACYPNSALERHDKSFIGWGLDPQAHYELFSEGQTPSVQYGEQLAQGVFHFEYDFDFPGVNTDPTKKTYEGGLRFDSAYYLWDKQGSIFDRAVPGIAYSKSDPKVARHAVFVDEARANPGASWPPKAGKRLLGGSPLHADSLHRVAVAKGHDIIRDRNRATARDVCYTRPNMPPALPEEGPDVDCDEYSYATTYEGAAGWRDPGGVFDPNKYRDEFAVRLVNRSHNQEAGNRLNSFYQTHRILDVDRLIPPWNQELDPNDQERFWVPITP